MKDWSNLARVVYRRTYSRKDSGVLENWDQTVERAIGANVKGKNVPEAEIKELLRLAKERKAGPAGRGYWFSGAPSHQKVGGAALNNCFAYETEIVTSTGSKKIGELKGTIQTILTDNGAWVEAPIRSFGKQILRKVTFIRHGKIKEVYATPDHQWIYLDKDGVRHDCSTDSLPENKRVPLSFGNGISSIYPSVFGTAAGIVFGDGSRINSDHGNGHIKLCGEKNKELLRYFNGCRTSEVEAGILVYDIPRFWKDFPDIRESRSYLFGWLAGYFAADGSVKEDGQTVLCSTNKKNLEFAKDVCYVLGIGAYPIHEQERISNLTGKNSTIYEFGFIRSTLTEDFFLLEEHKKRFNENPIKKENKYWRVKSVEETNRFEEVFCATVPKTHTFTLADNILTSNCWFLTAADWYSFVIAQDLLMLGGGVGLSVEHQFVSKLPKVRKDVTIVHKGTCDADFIVPDSREGWCELLYRALESHFVTGKSFSYSTYCLRGKDEPILGFGGTCSGPLPLIEFIKNLCEIFKNRQGKSIRPIDAADIIAATAQLVVSGNIRRSALAIIGDCWDKVYLKAKRWDLGQIPHYRSNANYSVVCDDTEDLHPLFWKTYEQGEPFGILNRTNIQRYGRMGELKPDTAIGSNPCFEAVLEPGEPCNLTEMALCNMESEKEFVVASRLMQRYAKRITLEKYHHKISDEVIKRNRRTGNGITGCLASPLFTPDVLDRAYLAIQDEDATYSKELGIPLSKRTTVVKPSGTMSKVLDCMGYEGIHAAYSRYMIQRVRFSSNDALIPKLREAGHSMEFQNSFGTVDPGTMVVDFYLQAPDGHPVADEDWDTWKQLDILKMAQKHWADQSVSVTVYYKKEEIPTLKTWLAENLQYLKTISFLCHSDHGFLQAPKQSITREQYEKLSSKVKPIEFEGISRKVVLFRMPSARAEFAP